MTIDYVAVARAYNTCTDGQPVKAVMDATGVPRSTAGRHIARARAAGLIPPTTPGRASPPDGDDYRRALAAELRHSAEWALLAAAALEGSTPVVRRSRRRAIHG